LPARFRSSLLSPIGGTVVDRANRHRIVVTTQRLSMAMPLVVAALTLTHHVRVLMPVFADSILHGGPGRSGC
jgi:hypothetical protein